MANENSPKSRAISLVNFINRKRPEIPGLHDGFANINDHIQQVFHNAGRIGSILRVFQKPPIIQQWLISLKFSKPLSHVTLDRLLSR